MALAKPAKRLLSPFSSCPPITPFQPSSSASVPVSTATPWRTLPASLPSSSSPSSSPPPPRSDTSKYMVWSFSGRVAYPRVSKLMSREVAPDNVYSSARSVMPRGIVTWAFPVPAGSRYLVRMHFCDMVSKVLYDLDFDIFVNGQLAVKDFDLSSATGFLAYPYYIDFIADVEDVGMLKLAIAGSKKSRSDQVSGILNGLEIMRLNKTAGGMDGDFPVALDMEDVVTKGVAEFARSLLCGFIFAGLFVVLVLLVLRLKAELRSNGSPWSRQPLDSGDGKLARAYQLVPSKTDY